MAGFCIRCGAALTRHDGQCPACGEAALRSCAQCGAAVPRQARFCAGCGAALAPVAAPAIARAPSAQPSERKLVTVMFVDMIGSLASIRDADPEEAHELFSRVLGAMTDAVHSCGGTVVRTLGDGLMVLFGAPAAREDHAIGACHAALRIIDAVGRIRSPLATPNVRIGLHSGLVVVGPSANDIGVDYDAVGVAVHIAARLQQTAAPGRAVMTAATRDLVAHEMLTASLGPKLLKGLDEPVEVFELHGIARQRGADGQETAGTFVGRASELAELAGALRSAQLGKGRFIAIVGEAGIGKTRLIERFMDEQAAQIRQYRVTPDRFADTIPFHAMRNLIAAMLGINGTEAEQRQPLLLPHLDGLGLMQEDIRVPLCALLEAGPLPDYWDDLDPSLRGQMTAAAIRSLITAESTRHPLLLAIDNIERADSATLTAIDLLGNVVGSHAILLIVSHRPDFDRDWHRMEGFRPLQLGSFSPREADELVDRLIAADAPQPLRRQLGEWSQGNPLFLHEAVNSMVDAGLLTGAPGERRLQDDAMQVAPPASIAAMIAERIDRLPARHKRILLTASVLGEQFPLSLLQAIAGPDAAGLEDSLAALVAQDFLRPLARQSEPAFGFRHAVFQEVCYASLLKKRRRELHAIALAALERGEQLAGGATLAGPLAHHAFRGGQWERAVGYCRAAGQRALSLSANREAARHFENAINALGRADPQEKRLADAIDLQLELRAALVPLLQLDKVGRILADSHARAQRLGDGVRLARITGFMAGHAYLTDRPQRAVTLALDALRLARRSGEAELQMAPVIYLGQALHALGRFRRSIAMLQRNLRAAPLPDPRATLGLPSLPGVMTARWIALSLAELGHFRAAEDYAGRSDRAGQTGSRPFDQVYSHSALGFLMLLRGDYEQAREHSEAAFFIAERRDLPFMIPVVASQLGLLLAYGGEPERGLQLARRAVRAAEDIGIAAGRSRWHARLGEVCLLAGDRGEALRQAEMALDIAGHNGEAGYACYARRLRGRISLESGSDDAALRQARIDFLAAAHDARRLQMAPLAAKCELDLAEVARRSGRASLAARHVARALAAFRQLGMPGWEARARQQQAMLEPRAA